MAAGAALGRRAVGGGLAAAGAVEALPVRFTSFVDIELPAALALLGAARVALAVAFAALRVRPAHGALCHLRAVVKATVEGGVAAGAALGRRAVGGGLAAAGVIETLAVRFACFVYLEVSAALALLEAARVALAVAVAALRVRPAYGALFHLRAVVEAGVEGGVAAGAALGRRAVGGGLAAAGAVEALPVRFTSFVDIELPAALALLGAARVALAVAFAALRVRPAHGALCHLRAVVEAAVVRKVSALAALFGRAVGGALAGAGAVYALGVRVAHVPDLEVPLACTLGEAAVVALAVVAGALRVRPAHGAIGHVFAVVEAGVGTLLARTALGLRAVGGGRTPARAGFALHVVLALCLRRQVHVLFVHIHDGDGHDHQQR